MQAYSSILLSCRLLPVSFIKFVTIQDLKKSTVINVVCLDTF